MNHDRAALQTDLAGETVRPIKWLASLEWLLAAGSMGIALWIFWTSVNTARAGWVAIPDADDWDRWITYLQYHYSPTWFLLQHVDHRLAAPKVLFAADHLLFRGRGWFVLACALGFQGVTGILLWRLAGHAYRQERSERVMQAAVIAAFVFSGQQWLNFIRPFQVQFPMVYCGAAAALFALWKSAEPDQKHGGRWIAVSIAMATFATYSMANGTIVWLVLLAGAVWLCIPRRWIAAIAAGTILIGATYFYHWHKSAERSDQLTIVERIPRIATFWAGHLGSPVFPLVTQRMSEKWEVAWAVIVGALLGSALLWVMVMFWRRRGRYSNAHSVLVLNCVFLVITSGTMAYGRSGWSMMDLYSPRYMTPSNIFWSSMLLVGWPLLRRATHVVLYAILCAAMLLGIAIYQREAVAISAYWTNITRLGEAGIIDNVIDPDPWKIIYHTPALTFGAIDYLKKNHLTIFTEEWTHWPGVPINSRFSIDNNPGACQGEFGPAVEIPGSARPGWHISGWAWDNKAGRAPSYIILDDGNSTVTGVGLTGFDPSPQFPPRSSQYPGSRWNGYVSSESRSVTAYILEADGRSLCAIGTQNLNVPAAAYYENKLVRRFGSGADDAKVYFIHSGKKQWVKNASWITRHGYRWPDDVLTISPAQLASIPEGEPISEP